MTNEKYVTCTSEEFKSDLSELCENCPLTDLIIAAVNYQIIFQAEQQKSILSKQDFQKYLTKETESAINKMEEIYILELQNKDNKNDQYRKNRIDAYIFNKERIKALKKFIEEEKPNQSGPKSFTWTGSQAQLEALYQALIKAGYIHPDTTNEAFTAIFASGLIKDRPVQWLGSNRLLSYLFNQMNSGNSSLILSQDWQSVIEKYTLFKNKSGKLLKAGDLSTALSNIQDVNTGLNPKGSKKIDEILKNIKTLRP